MASAAVRDVLSAQRAKLRGFARTLFRHAKQNPLLAALTLAVVLPCALLLSVEVRSLRGAIYDIHEWRQGETYSVAYAFVHEGASVLLPKHAWRGDLSGIVGMEAPVYPWVVSWFMRVFGDSFLIARLVNFAFFVLAFGWQLQRFTRSIGFSYALGALLMVAFSPAALCEFRQMQPDPMALSLCVLAAGFFHAYGATGARKQFVWGLMLFTVGLLTKPIVIATLPAMWLFAVCGARTPKWWRALLLGACFALPLALMFSWDWWANQLVQRYMGGNLLISIDHDPATMWREMQNVGLRRLILLALLENYPTHVTLFPAVAIGMALSMRRDLRAWGIPFLAWFVGAVIISGAFASRYPSNWYYLLPYLPPVVFFGAVSLGTLFEVVSLRTRDPRQVAVAAAVALSMLFVWPQLRELPWAYAGPDIGQLAVHVRHEVSESVLYWVCIAAALLFAWGLFQLRDGWLRLPHASIAALLTVVTAWSLIIPFRDVKQTVRFYTKEELWQQGIDDLREMRAAVDRFSTPKDLFVMNEYHPGLLARAHRVGWADSPGVIQAVGIQHYASRGGRFFMNFYDTPPTPPTMQSAPVLAKGERWELRCIDPKGCPPR